MAACLPPSPSGRRLSELLEEKQQPFLLDIHLLEKGCSSSRLLDAYDTAMCWPAPGNAVLKRLTASKKNSSSRRRRQGEKRQNQKPTSGLLKLLLSKVLPGTAARAPKPPALQFADSFKEKETTRCSNSDSCTSDSESYDDEKQLSPVSVLDRPFESSPVHANGKLMSPSRNAAMDVLRELLDAALLARSDDLAIKDTEECCYHGYRTSPKNNGARYDDAAYWDAHRAELARVSALVAAEVPSARLDATAAVQPEREDVGAGVADAVLHALVHELVVDLRCC